MDNFYTQEMTSVIRKLSSPAAPIGLPIRGNFFEFSGFSGLGISVRDGKVETVL